MADQGLLRPTLQQGIARSPGESVYPELWRDLMGAWVPQAGPQGINQLRDFSNNKNHAAFQGGMGDEDWEIDRYGYALAFDGTNDAVEATISGLTYPFSIVVLIRTPNANGPRQVVSLNDASDTDLQFTLGIQVTTNTWSFGARANTGFTYATGTAATSEWTHLIGVAESNTSRLLYVNGILEATDTTSRVFNMALIDSMFMGGLGDVSPNFYGSKIAHTYLYNRTILSNEALAMAQGASPLTLKRYILGKVPAVGAGSLIKTWNGLADASVKTVNGLARANVKTRNGLA